MNPMDGLLTGNESCARAVSFWTAAVNWRLAGDIRYVMMRKVFSKHKRLKELLDWMIRRVDRKDEVCQPLYPCVSVCFDPFINYAHIPERQTRQDARGSC
jgi:hypothetical protein